jgi:eukaryotic-like serine/threonine-protein kinase
MAPERWREVDRLLEQALDTPPAERPAFLKAACAGDTALRLEVERLLVADEKARIIPDLVGPLSGRMLPSPGEFLCRYVEATIRSCLA